MHAQTTIFDHDVRVVACENCGGPLQTSLAGGAVACRFCGAGNQVRMRDEVLAVPQVAIAEGYERAWATILDSNVTTLIAGLALLVFGSGAIRGFAIVHCLGIMTSIFSAVVVSRGIVNLWYGRQKKLAKLSIGQVWKPTA